MTKPNWQNTGKWRSMDDNIPDCKDHRMPMIWEITNPTLTLPLSHTGLFILCGDKVCQLSPPKWSRQCGFGYLAPSVTSYPPEMSAELQIWAPLSIELCHVNKLDEKYWKICLDITIQRCFFQCWGPYSKALELMNGNGNLSLSRVANKRPFLVSLKAGNELSRGKNTILNPERRHPYYYIEGFQDRIECINLCCCFFINLLTQPQTP